MSPFYIPRNINPIIGGVIVVAGRTLDGIELPALVALPLLSDDGAVPAAAPPVQLFFERAGRLRYPSVERAIETGTWTVRDGRLCTQKESGFERCWTVCRRKDAVILWRHANNYARGTLRAGDTVRPAP